MSLAEVIVTTIVALFAAAALMSAHRALRARARAARREQIARDAERAGFAARTGVDVPNPDRVFDQHALDDPLSEYEEVAWRKVMDAWERSS